MAEEEQTSEPQEPNEEQRGRACAEACEWTRLAVGPAHRVGASGGRAAGEHGADGCTAGRPVHDSDGVGKELSSRWGGGAAPRRASREQQVEAAERTRSG